MRLRTGEFIDMPAPQIDRLLPSWLAHPRWPGLPHPDLARYHLTDRFRAWWEGKDYVPPPEDETEPLVSGMNPAPEPTETATAPPARGWSQSRVAVVQALFGEGFITAGGAEAILAMIKPLALNEAMSVLDVGAGLGGAARLIAQETGAWVTGCEEDELLAATAMEISTVHGMSRKAGIEKGRVTDMKLRRHSMDAVISKDAIYRAADKEEVYKAINAVLKPGGQIMIKDFALGEGGAGPALAAWTELEGRPLQLWEPGQTRAALKKLGFRIRITEDVTEEYRHHILTAFSDFADSLRRGEIDEELRPWAISEGEMWFRRVAALESGEVGVCRIYGSLPEAPPE